MAKYRLFLALMVILHHYGLYAYAGFGVGWSADVGFMILAGYTAAAVLACRPELSNRDYRLRRIRHLLVPYYLWLFLTALVIATDSNGMAFPCESKGVMSTVADVLILPGPYFYFDATIADCSYLPQGWFLGFIIPCYLVFPTIIRHRKPLILQILYVAGLGIATLGYFHIIEPRSFGLFLPPAGIYLFVLGIVSYFYYREGGYTALYPVMCAVAVLVLVLSLFAEPRVEDVNREVLAGLVMTLVALAVFKGETFTTRDAMLGKVALGVFLSHYTLLYLLTGTPLQGPVFIIVHVGLSVILGYASIVFCERLWTKNAIPEASERVSETHPG